jgi:hypothetical protein
VAKRDDFEFDDLGGVDLSKLDLRDIEVDEDRPSPVLRWLALLLLLGLGGVILWFPTTPYYQLYGRVNWVFFLICAVAIVVGVSTGRWLWAWAQEAARAYAARRALEEPEVEAPKGPPSALRRFLTLLVVIGGFVAILVGLPASGLLQSGGSGFTGAWFLAAVGAVAIGITLGRWLVMQGQVAANGEPVRRRPIRLPPWFKWVTLTLLVVVAVSALAVPTLAGGGLSNELRFGLGGVGLIVGVVAAIWLARRFDETEARLRQRRSGGLPENRQGR